MKHAVPFKEHFKNIKKVSSMKKLSIEVNIEKNNQNNQDNASNMEENQPEEEED